MGAPLSLSAVGAPLSLRFVRGMTWVRVLVLAAALAWIVIMCLTSSTFLRVYGVLTVVSALVVERGIRRQQAVDR